MTASTFSSLATAPAFLRECATGIACRTGRQPMPRSWSPSNRSHEDGGEYSDIDMTFKAGRYTGGGGYFHKDGTPY